VLQRGYCPELADWIFVSGPDEYTFHLCDQGKLVGQCGGAVATVQIHRSFTKDAAFGIMSLIECAPDLWQCLRDLAKRLSVECDPDVIEAFSEAWKMLALAADRNPFAPAQDHCDDELRRKKNDPRVMGADDYERGGVIGALMADKGGAA
jgi:hypothetical protein